MLAATHRLALVVLALAPAFVSGGRLRNHDGLEVVEEAASPASESPALYEAQEAEARVGALYHQQDPEEDEPRRKLFSMDNERRQLFSMDNERRQLFSMDSERRKLFSMDNERRQLFSMDNERRQLEADGEEDASSAYPAEVLGMFEE